MSVSDQSVAAVGEVVTRIIAEVLKRPVSDTDNLLELGVDSLVGTHIVVLIRAELEVDVPLLVLFENPILGDFTAEVAELVQDLRNQSRLPVRIWRSENA